MTYRFFENVCIPNIMQLQFQTISLVDDFKKPT